jgi:hypothetical protein
MSGIDPASVTQALVSEGLEVNADEEEGVWSMVFEVNTRNQTVILIAPSSPPDESVFSHYLLAVSRVVSDRLELPIDQLPASTLRTLLKAQAEVLLAKLDYWTIERKTSYVTVSPCSIVNIDGAKLRRRLEACADLASRIRAALLEPNEGV